MHNFNTITINHPINEIMKDLKNTSDPVKRALLQKFMDIKVRELRYNTRNPGYRNHSDVLIDVLSNPGIEIDQGVEEQEVEKQVFLEQDNTKLNEIDELIKRQNQGLSDLDNLSKVRAYKSLIQENEKTLPKQHEKQKKPWDNASKDKSSKLDSMSHGLMERFNSEIDFRNEENQQVKMTIQKPFDDDYDDNVADTFARFEQLPDEDMQKSKAKAKAKARNFRTRTNRSLEY